ncbi:exopolyphosphatase [Phycicoccus duodecadis]|uniref:Exopolyphosphatase/guanosine-5'-triphosphate, 3'-diphosphate pyrophosphatase n=1 Tax=Phycicoccus duodecadis TaxID=173053 RepID=A0A2N3YKQ3_9MICO|nr:exopolyphosphatase [Phycicoccus duodecadis]PKW27447.1 exopolyphosphatase/guanosine-5'-triphosphate,3'-diphosphate pyrophosphatase [Phycicoccus duodecadis]
MTGRRVAAVDCGTNSIRLLIADVGDDGLLTDVVRRTEVVRLGQGIDRTGVIAPDAMERTLARSREYAAQCRERGVRDVRFVATSASRDARNADEFVAGVREAFGDLDVAPEVVAGDVEARLSFTGATGDLRRLGIPGPYLVVDLGGGSTELVRGTDAVEAGRSIDIGCVRLTERHLAGDPPTDDEVVAARADVAAALDTAEEVVDLAGLSAVVGLAGSITTVTAHLLALDRYDPEAVHLAELPLAEHRTACRGLLGMARADRGALPYMHPGRVDVIGAGALVWHEVLGRVALRSPGARVVTSEHDILDGIALSVAAR